MMWVNEHWNTQKRKTQQEHSSPAQTSSPNSQSGEDSEKRKLSDTSWRRPNVISLNCTKFSSWASWEVHQRQALLQNQFPTHFIHCVLTYRCWWGSPEQVGLPTSLSSWSEEIICQAEWSFALVFKMQTQTQVCLERRLRTTPDPWTSWFSWENNGRAGIEELQQIPFRCQSTMASVSSITLLRESCSLLRGTQNWWKDSELSFF